MSAILSSDDLNDFISPGVACIKPIENLPRVESTNAYEVTTEDKLAAANAPPATISLTDCLACSGCVTSAEAVLVSLQSHTEVLNTLDSFRSWKIPSNTQEWSTNGANGTIGVHATNAALGMDDGSDDSKIFVASVSPQVRASLAAVYGITERQAGSLIEQLLGGPHGLKTGGTHGSYFSWIFDTNTVREAALVLAADEVQASLAQTADGGPKRPILTSACPGWICFAEKTHPYVLPHLSRLKSPQALAGTLVKSVLSKKYNIHPSRIWHLAIMPCFDKKLEASRTELTSASWAAQTSAAAAAAAAADDAPVRDVDCVITARELIHLATARNINLPLLPLIPFTQPPFPDTQIHSFLFTTSPSSSPSPRTHRPAQCPSAGTSGGYLHHILSTLTATHPNTSVTSTRGRNADVMEYALVDNTTGQERVRMARYYGFRNIQNLVRRLKPKRASRMPGAAVRKMGAGGGTAGEKEEFAYVEVMACPGGCTNGGGQVRVSEVEEVRRQNVDVVSDGNGVGEGTVVKPGVKEQKEWLARVDEAYYSAESEASDSDPEGLRTNGHSHPNGTGGSHAHDEADAMDIDASPPPTTITSSLIVNGIDHKKVHALLEHWAGITGVELEKLVFTTYREVESDVGKSKTKKVSDVERVAGLASAAGGGW